MNECLKEALTFDEDAESRDSRFDLVAEPANGVDQPLILAVAQLLAELAHVDLDDVGQRIAAVAPQQIGSTEPQST